MAFAGTRTRGSACGCCEGTCIIVSDDFDRADSGTVSGWTEVAGTWAIESNKLRGSSARALIVNDTAHPDGPSGAVRANVTIEPDYTAGDNASRLTVAYHDADNYLFAEVRLIDGGCLEFQLGQRDGGAESWLTEETRLPEAFNDALKLFLCWQPSYDSSAPMGRLSGYVQSTTNNGTEWPYRVYLEAEADAAGASADQFGLEVTDGETLFNDWAARYHYDDPDHPNCPTCTTGCVIFGDSFGSALSSCLWNQVSGSWSTSGGELVIPSTGVLIALRPDPRVSGGYRAYALFDPATTSDKLQIIVDYLDSNNYHFAEIQPGTTNGTLKLFKRSGGSNTQLGSTTINGFTTSKFMLLAVCWFVESGQGLLRASASSQVTRTYNPSGDIAVIDQVLTAPLGGRFAGIGAGGGGGAICEEFKLSILRDDNCEECGGLIPCVLQCESGTVPRLLRLLVSGVVNDGCNECTQWNGTFLAEAQGSTTPPLYGSADCNILSGSTACYWVGQSFATLDMCGAVAVGGVSAAIIRHGNDYYLEGYISGSFSDPSDPFYVAIVYKFRTSLGTFSTVPDCRDLLSMPVAVPLLCNGSIPNGLTFDCDFTNATIEIWVHEDE